MLRTHLLEVTFSFEQKWGRVSTCTTEEGNDDEVVNCGEDNNLSGVPPHSLYS